MILLLCLLLLTSAISNAIVDCIQHHYHRSIFSRFNQQWWNPELSWKNKYNISSNRLLSMFFTTWGVTFTDAFHCFKMIRDTSLLIALSLLIHQSMFSDYYFILVFVVVKISYSTIFHIFYNAFKH